MDHDVRACRCDGAGQRCRVEDVDHDRVRPERAQRVGFRFRPGAATDVMASAVQERRQATADGPRRAGKEDSVTHHRYSLTACAARASAFHSDARLADVVASGGARCQLNYSTRTLSLCAAEDVFGPQVRNCRQTTTHKLLRDFRHALAEVFSGQKIGFGWRKVRSLIGVRLCRSTEPEA